MKIPYYHVDPAPPTSRDKTIIPDQTANLFEKITLGWLFPLLRTGYTRPVQEEDVWSLDDSRLTETLTDQLERNFYTRCPPSRRPLHHGGIRTKSSDALEPFIEEQSGGDDVKTSRLGRLLKLNASSHSGHASQDFSTTGSNVLNLGVDQPMMSRTLSLVENVSRISQTESGVKVKNSVSEKESSCHKYTFTRLKANIQPQLDILHRLNPLSNYQKLGRNEKDNIVVEEDEKGIKRAYDSSLLKALIRTTWRRLIVAMCLKALHSVIMTTSSLVTKQFIMFISRSHEWTKADDSARGGLDSPLAIGTGICLAIGLAVMQEAGSLFNNHYQLQSAACGVMMESAIISQIARKSLRLSPKSRVEYTNGRQTAAIGADCGQIDWCFPLMVQVAVDPLIIVVGFILLILNLGPSALVGVGLLATASPLMALLYKGLSDSRQQQMKMMDRRIRLTTEILSTIRQIKLYAYEAYFGKRILDYREKELARLRKQQRSFANLSMLMTLIPTLAAVLSFVTYSLSGHDLDVATIFASLQLFNVIQYPMASLPMAITALADAHIAILRISKILTAEEQPHGLVIDPTRRYAIDATGDFTYETVVPPDQLDKSERLTDKELIDKKSGTAIASPQEIDQETRSTSGSLRLSASGEKEQANLEPFSIKDVNLRILPGHFVCIFGRIGSGKTALLEGLLGEMRQTRGQVIFNGQVSLVTQSPWIQNSSLKENILFGNALDMPKLQATMRACALTKDLEQLSDGLDTEIGERGINLSGGQRSRIALARASYSDANVVLLDDPLSAVDSHVSSHITESCLLGLLKNRTRVLVTHHLEVAPHADLILVMDNGRIIQQGSYEELMNVEGTFRSLIHEYGATDGPPRCGTDANSADVDKVDFKNNPTTSSTQVELSHATPVAVTKLHLDEERSEGAVSWKVYVAYIKALFQGGPFFVALAACILTECTSVALTLVLGFWSGSTIPGFSRGQYMGIYAGLGIGEAIFAFLGTYATSLSGIGASFMMAQRALKAVLRSPVAFHDRTPSGRIISRLTVDVESLDNQLPSQLNHVFGGLLSICGTIGLVFYAYAYLGIMFVPMFVFYYLFGLLYGRTSRQLRRIRSNSRSYVFSTFGEQLTGVISIRAYQKQNMFNNRINKTIDNEARFYYVSMVMKFWLALRLDLLGSGLILGIALFGVFFRNEVSPSKLSVVLAYTIQTTQVFSDIVISFTRLEQEMNTCERIMFYGQLPVEAAGKTKADPNEDWPSKGAVTFDSVELKYRPEFSPVLKGISFQISPGEKIGIVGRTGAGKSSCLQALFRLVELSAGKIVIDGVNLAHIGVDTLRHRLSAIPQEPLLFSGTLRENLDPARQRTDAELHDALQRCGLTHSESSNRDRFQKFKLDAQVADEGSNFSGGERQLVALCRAIVKNRKVLMLDEATSSVDPETDAKIQKTIRAEFNDVTLLSIAHRLATIAFYDRVLVLDQGTIVEMDTPLNLYDQEDSVFRSMCDAAQLEREAIVENRSGA